MSDLALIFFACFGASLATSVFWRLYTQLPRQDRRSEFANREDPRFHNQGQ